MNEHARKKARRAELEYVLLEHWHSRYREGMYTYLEWLEEQGSRDALYALPEAKELIALYEEEM